MSSTGSGEGEEPDPEAVVNRLKRGSVELQEGLESMGMNGSGGEGEGEGDEGREGSEMSDGDGGRVRKRRG